MPRRTAPSASTAVPRVRALAAIRVPIARSETTAELELLEKVESVENSSREAEEAPVKYGTRFAAGVSAVSAVCAGVIPLSWSVVATRLNVPVPVPISRTPPL